MSEIQNPFGKGRPLRIVPRCPQSAPTLLNPLVRVSLHEIVLILVALRRRESVPPSLEDVDFQDQRLRW